MESHRKGDLTEAVVVAELLRREIPVSTPFGDNERYDLVVEADDGRLLRLQVKTGWLRDGRIEFHGRSQHTNSGGNVYEQYENDVDYFLVYCHELESMYLVEEDRFDSKFTLRVDEPRQVDRSVKWAEDFEFDRRWPPDRNDLERIHGSGAGVSTDRAVIDEFRDREIPVARPETDHVPYDLVAEAPTGFVTILVRTGWLDDGVIKHRPDRGESTPDLLAVFVHRTEDLYLVPGDGYGSTITLRIEDPETPHGGINWAEDYAFDRRWPPDADSGSRPGDPGSGSDRE